MTRLLITLCTYNERRNLEQLIPEVLEAATTGLPSPPGNADHDAAVPEARNSPPLPVTKSGTAAEATGWLSGPESNDEVALLVIDDGSPDGTGEFVTELGEQDARIRLLQRHSKQGLGTATLAGFRYAIENGFDLLLNLDADFSHNPAHIPALIAATRTCDVAIGSRYVPGGSVGNWTVGRRLMSRLINLAAQWLLGLRTRDNSGSFRCYRVSRLAAIDWSRTLARGYAFQEEILYRCRRLGCTFQECPITFEERRFGETKISARECVAAVTVIARLGWHRLLRRPVT